ncbi:MAG: selenium metabolism-associated LysR family transcriptional regulator [Desulfotomaculaceae bacterium]|nr:selenium metabolism-associated LysR family transcriptional regulator [Desulfotomaculaceae bacterium]
MNFKQLEAFVWVAELQSFTKAARQLFMSQPAVSFQIKALEEELEVTLFNRGDKKMILTEAGHLLYPDVKQMLKHYQKIKNELEDLRGLKTGHLVIGAGTIPGEYLLPHFIGKFNQRYPGIKISLKVSGSGQVERWVREREADLGIIGVPIEDENITCTPWLQDQLVLITFPLHPWLKSDTIKISDLIGETIILREQGSGTRRTIEQKLAEYHVPLDKIRVGMELGSTRAVITAVEAGLGFSIVSCYAARESLELGRVMKVNVDGFDLRRFLYLIRHRQSLGGFAVDAFTDLINDQKVISDIIGE